MNAGKYIIDVLSGEVVNKESLAEIPAEEPVFLLRAQDPASVPTMIEYQIRAQDPAVKAGVAERIREFLAWQTQHRTRPARD